MEQWIRQTLGAEALGLSVLPAALLLGVLGALSSCCTLPVIAAVAGYSGSLAERRTRRELVLIGLFFMLGTIVSMAALGAVSGFVGHVAGAALGRSWRLAAGLVMVLFGLASLDLVPFRIPKVDLGGRGSARGPASAMVCGLAVGGATTACSVGCNPLISIALSATVLQGATMLGAAILAVFAFGYSLPLSAGLIGLGFGVGGLSRITQRAAPIMRVCAGVLLIGVGFFLLWPT